MARIVLSQVDQLPRRSFVGRLGEMLRQILITLVILAACAVIGWQYLLSRVDREIRLAIEQRLEHQFGNAAFRVRVGSARRVDGKGIEIRDLQITPYSESLPIVEIDEVFLYCNPEMERLVTQTIQVHHVDLKRPLLRVVQTADGTWNVQALCGNERILESLPTIAIRDGQVELQLAGGGTTRWIGLDLQLTPEAHTGADPDFPFPIRLEATVSNDHFRLAECRGLIDPNRCNWELTGHVHDLAISEKLYEQFPMPAGIAMLRSLHGNGQLSLRASSLDGEVTYAIDGRLENGHWKDPRLSTPFTDIQATIHATQDGFRIDELTARSGKAGLEMNLSWDGYDSADPGELWLRAEQFELSDELLAILPAPWQTSWNKFSPHGFVNAEVRLRHEDNRWSPEITVECLGISFAYHRFPYGMTNGRGTVHWAEGLLQTSDFTAYARDQMVRFRGQVRNPGESFTGFVEIESEGLVPIDDKLVKALDSKLQNVVRMMRPSGAMKVWGRIERMENGELDRRLELGLEDCTIDYVKFPYRIEKVRGMLFYANGNWRFPDLRGMKDTVYLACKGAWHANDKGVLEMHFDATDVTLDDDLFHALKPSAQRLWDVLRPRGAIDHLGIDLRYVTEERDLTLDVKAQKWPPQANIDGRKISFEPIWLPVPWNDVVGSVRYVNGQVEFTDLKMSRGHTTTQFSGRGHLTGEDSWRIDFDKLIVSGLTFDRELAAALPPRLGQVLNGAGIEGRYEVQGTASVSGVAGEMPSVQCDVEIDVENGRVLAGAPMESICGQVHLRGIANDRGVSARGELRIDSLFCKDIHLTSIKGPIWIHSDQIVLGDFLEAQKPPDRAPRSLTLRAFGGSIAANARIMLEPETPFQLDAVADRLDFAEFAQDMMPQRKRLSGKVSAGLNLRGTAAGVHTWFGTGNVKLTQADLYELPVLFAMFKNLKVGRPTRGAFDICESRFRLEANHAYLDQIDFKGDALTLKGSGDLGFDRRVNLVFYGIVGRDMLNVPLITPALKELSRQLAQFKVEGSLDDPKVTQETVPIITEALQQMFPELAVRSQNRMDDRQERKQDGMNFPFFRQSSEKSRQLPWR